MNRPLVLVVVAILSAGACSGLPTSSTLSLSAGSWSGTTAHGRAISFEVSSAEVLTTLSVAFSFNGCAGTQTFANLNVSTLPNVVCIGGPCPNTLIRQFDFSNGTPGSGPVTRVNAQFRPGGQAFGVVDFRDYPGCGTVERVEWTATRR